MKKKLTLVFAIFSLFFTSITIKSWDTPSSSNDINSWLHQESLDLLTGVDLMMKQDEQEVMVYREKTTLHLRLTWEIPESIIENLAEDASYLLTLDNQLKIESTNTGTIVSDTQVRFSFDRAKSGTLDLVTRLSDVAFSKLQTDSIVIELNNTTKPLQRFVIPKLETEHAEKPLVPSAVEGAKDGAQVSRFEIYADAPDSEHLSGSEIIFYTGISLSNTSSTLHDFILEIQVPKTYVVSGSFAASDIMAQRFKYVFDEVDQYRVEYHLPALTSGNTLDVPIKFSTDNGMTPDQAKILVAARLKQEDGNDLVPVATAEFTINIVPPVLSPALYHMNSIGKGSWLEQDGFATYAGRESAIRPGFFSDDLAHLTPVRLSYTLRGTQLYYDFGSRFFKTFVVKSTLPEGAVFVADDNPGWEYNEGTRQATYVYTHPQGIRLFYKNFYQEVVLSLKFPGVALQQNITNVLEVTAIPQNQAEFEPLVISRGARFFSLTNEETPHDFIVSKYGTTLHYFDSETDRQKSIPWQIKITNKGAQEGYPNLLLENLIVNDYDLDERLHYTHLEFDVNQAPVGTLKIQVTDSEGKVTVLAPALDVLKTPSLKLPEDSSAIQVAFNKDTYLEPDQHFLFTVHTELNDKKTPIFEHGSTQNHSFFQSSALASGNYVGETTYYGEATPTIYFTKKGALGLNKVVYNKKDHYFLGDIIEHRLSLNLYGFAAGSGRVETNKLVNLLPVGTEYIKDSAVLEINKAFIKTALESGALEPEIVTNFMGTGHVALVWDLASLEPTNPKVSDQLGLISLYYQTQITTLTQVGINTDTTYVAWENTDTVDFWDQGIQDIFDLNHNGLTTDFITHSRSQFNYVPPRELLLFSAVKGSLDSAFVLPPTQGSSELDSEVIYQLTLYNNSVNDIQELYLLDILPDINDQTMATESQRARGSTFKPTLTGPVSVPAGYHVLYTTTLPEKDVAAFYREADWQATLSDYTAVTAIRLELRAGQRLRAGETQTFLLSLQVPSAVTPHAKAQAVNSFGLALSQGLTFLESNHASLGLIRYQVSGQVFEDVDQDGFYNESIDQGLAGVAVQLVDEFGNEVVDAMGQKYQMFTTSDGDYHFDVDHQGEYRLQVLAEPDHQSTLYQDDPLGSHLVDESRTAVFTLNRQQATVVRNAGYYLSAPRLNIQHELYDAKDHPLVKDIDFDFQLSVNDVPYEGSGQLYNSEHQLIKTVDIRKGRFRLPANHQLDVVGLPQAGSYSVQETLNPDYETNPRQGIWSGVLKEQRTTVVFSNKVKLQTLDFRVTKAWQGGPEEKPDIALQLYRNNKAVDQPVILKSGQTNYIWQNLAANDEVGNPYLYTIDEVYVPLYYDKHLSSDGHTITNTYTLHETTHQVVGDDLVIWLHELQQLDERSFLSLVKARLETQSERMFVSGSDSIKILDHNVAGQAGVYQARLASKAHENIQTVIQVTVLEKDAVLPQTGIRMNGDTLQFLGYLLLVLGWFLLRFFKKFS